MQSSNLRIRPLVRGVRAFTRDNGMITYDGSQPVMDHSPLWPEGSQVAIAPGKPLGYGVNGRNGVQVSDGNGGYRVVDSTGAFLVGELERMDMKLHAPLAAVTYGRDIDMREDATIADEFTSFTLTTFAAAGNLGVGNGIGNGKAWAGKAANQIGGINVDISKAQTALTLWAMELKYTIPELESAAKIGRPIDAQKYAGLQLKYQMDCDEQVYIGDTSLSQTGLVNNALVTPANVANGAGGSPLWTQKTPDEILTDFNTALNTVWTNSAFAVIPSRILLPTSAYGYIATQKVSLAGNMSILQYILANNLLARAGQGQLEIVPAKFCNGAGAGGTIGTGNVGKDRMVVYTKDYDRVRFPMTLLQRTPIQYDGLYQKTTYFGRLGAVEVVYPDTVGYFDQMS